MEPHQPSDNKPVAMTNPVEPPYQTFPPPPPESGSGHSQTIPLEAMRYQAYHPPSQEPPGSIPTVGLVPPTPAPPLSAQPGNTFQQLHQPPAELPAYIVDEEPGPPLPQRPPKPATSDVLPPPPPGLPPPHKTHQKAFTGTPSTAGFAPPPQRHRPNFGEDDPAHPTHYVRDPHKLIAYLVPFPTPHLNNAPGSAMPPRFLIYTPPPPPLHKPSEGEKEGVTHKVQRKWQNELRAAKSSTAKTASLQGVRYKLTRGVGKGMNYLTSSNLDFVGRTSPSHSKPTSRSTSPASEPDFDDKEHPEESSTHKTIGIEEMVLVYPPTMNLTPDQMREEFINTMLRTKSKATRDSIISSSLLPISWTIDILAVGVGGLGELNTAWAYVAIRGAKNARSLTKRLSSSTSAASITSPADLPSDPHNPNSQTEPDPTNTKDSLKLSFIPSTRLEILRNHLDAACHKVDPKLFPTYKSPPLESDVLEAIGWSPHQSGGETRNWEDEQWEMTEVKEDLKIVMHKGAKEWRSWCKTFEKNPEKSVAKYP